MQVGVKSSRQRSDPKILDWTDDGLTILRHKFSGSYHARLPSQWGKQVLGFNITRALMQYYSKAALKLRHQEVVNTSRVAPVGVPGISRSSVLAPRSSLNLSHGADPHSSSYM